MAGTDTTMGQEQGLVDACGVEPGYTCEWIWDATGNEGLASLVEWLIERPLKVVVILVGALIVNRLVKRAIDRMVSRLVETRTQEQTEAEDTA
ncbi:uncharacterized protein METZ01_LOCUS370844, partial [marine metagenome]